MAVTLMWEAKAAPGRGAELLAWARAQRLDPPPERRETFTAPGDRVLVLTWWPNDHPDLPELPSPPPTLLARPPHHWRFTPVPS
ncbi:hypothetical protein [Streptomyces profundus]|uniref:hypothetical protein n=1 Tax=Streptomyces profundus TaxID=2867410 RepID=UPI001D162D73|nr:hypothetical protein [Streptomyces sp. MA3_2.13]UED84590.1 hypothetical protein K4G22_10560 [Streptomyces sp. MA3_2.13]